MAYQGSAQSIGFRNRTVADPSKRMREEAARIEQRGKERIARWRGKRLNKFVRWSVLLTFKLATPITSYELYLILATQSTVVLQEDVLVMEKRRIEGEIEDVEEDLRCYQGPAFQQQKEVVQALAANQAAHDLDVKATEMAAKDPDEPKATVSVNFLDGKSMSWELVTSKKLGRTCGVYLDNELLSNETLITDDEGNVV